MPWFFYLNPLLTAGVAFLVYKTARRTRAVVFGALFFLVNVIFLLQVLAAGSAFLADRYTYIAYAGLIFIAVWAMEQLVRQKRERKQWVAFATVAVIAVFMVVTYNRCEVWKNGETLWTDVIEKYPGQNVASYSNRGIAYTNTGQWDNALADFTKAIAINPKYPVSYANRGVVYGNLGQTENAIADFTKALEIDTTYKLVLHNRGVAYGETGQYDKAVSDLLKAIRLDPKYISAINNLSIIYCQVNKLDSAIKICRDGLKANPESAQLHAALGNCFLEKGETGDAVVQYRKCLETSDRNIDALLGMAVASYLKHDLPYAKGYINQARSVEPALNDGMEGIEKLEKAGHPISEGKKEIISRIFSLMK